MKVRLAPRWPRVGKDSPGSSFRGLGNVLLQRLQDTLDEPDVLASCCRRLHDRLGGKSNQVLKYQKYNVHNTIP